MAANNATIPGGSPIAGPIYLVDQFGVPLSSIGGGTQYTDGNAAPAHPIGTELVYNNAGTMTAVSSANPFPTSATVTPAANQRVNAQANDFVAGSIVDLATLAGIVASSKAAVQDIETANYIAATSPPTATNAGSDTSYTFSSQVNRVIIQNNTSANVNYAFDATATAGSLALVPGAMLVYPKKCTILHLYTAAAQNINGTAAANIVVLGAL